MSFEDESTSRSSRRSTIPGERWEDDTDPHMFPPGDAILGKALRMKLVLGGDPKASQF